MNVKMQRKNEGRKDLTMVFNCLGTAEEDINVETFSGEHITPEVVITTNPNEEATKLGHSPQQFVFGVSKRYDIKKTEAKYDNGVLIITIPIKGGVNKSVKVNKNK